MNTLEKYAMVSIGLLLVVLGSALFEDEKKNIQSKVETLWIRLDDSYKESSLKFLNTHIDFAIVSSKFILNRLLSKDVMSMKFVLLSTIYSIIGVLLLLVQTNELEMLIPIIITLGFSIVVYLTSIYIKFKYFSLFAITSYLIIGVLFTFGFINIGTFGKSDLYEVILFSSMSQVIIFILSIIPDLMFFHFFFVIFNNLLNEKSLRVKYIGLMKIVILYVFVFACSLFVFAIFSEFDISKDGVRRVMVLYCFSNVLNLLPICIAIVSIVAIPMNKLILNIARRWIYKLHSSQIIVSKWGLSLLGLGLIIYPFNKELVNWLTLI